MDDDRDPGARPEGRGAAASPEPMPLEVLRDGPVSTVVVAGEVDLLTADHLRDTLMEQVAARPEVLVVDLDAVEFLSSMGLAALALTQRAAHETGVVLRVVASTQVTLRPLQVTSMTDQLAVYASRAEALAGGSGAEPSARIG
jgi:anti-sigma B factor antagonist